MWLALRSLASTVMYPEFLLNTQGISLSLVYNLFATSFHYLAIISSTCVFHFILPFLTFSLVSLIFPFSIPFTIFRQNQHSIESWLSSPGSSRLTTNQHTINTWKDRVNRKVQIVSHKNTISYTHHTDKTSSLTILGVCKHMEQLELPNAVCWNANWHNCSGDQSGIILKIPFSFDQQFPF